MTKEARRAWLEERRKGLGGSDIAALLGLTRYRSPLDVYVDKVGLTEIDDVETDAQMMGHLLEPVIAGIYAEREGVELYEPDVSPVVHPDYPWLRGTPDRLVRGQRLGLEIKTAGHRQERYWGTPGTDQVPPYYAAQAWWYMALFGYDRWDVAVLFAGQRFATYHLTRDRDVERNMLELAEWFWTKHVEPRIPPEPMERDGPALALVHPTDDGRLETGTDSVVLTAAELSRVKAEQAELDEVRLALESKLKARIGDHAGYALPNGGKVTWKKAKDGQRFDVKAAIASGAISDEVQRRFTRAQPGNRRFYLSWKGKGELSDAI